MLSTHLASSSKSNNELQPTNVASFTTGTYFSVTLIEVFSSPQYWIVDSGATRLICSIASAFTSLHHIKNSTITLPNHTRIPASLAGDVQINHHLILKDVLFVPTFKFNLLSVSALTSETKLTVQFLPDHFEIQEICSQMMIDRGKRVEDLYVLDAATLNSVSSTYVNNVSAQVWHNRLGHISFKRLDSLKSHLHYIVITVVQSISFISLHPDLEDNPPGQYEILISDHAPILHNDAIDVSPTTSPFDSHLGHPIERIPHDHNTHLRRSSRVPQPPSYLRDFHCSLVS
ncbi:hypothetical protein LWI29_013591 [Acer saccharum]|uniref:GAG-pre-integrase domain-containing protein n=1 Tax=Acer saccharum TaxID=4024 RepID=A0AA39S8R9_ACESA|nr:hypothetical protein LWI29_013591 [Acer saccharum]